MEIFGQTFESRDVIVLLLLVLLEGILSIDNALVLGLLARRLPKHLQTRALTYGLIGAFVFRFVAVGTATFLLRWTFVKFLGGAYLVYIAARHLLIESHEKAESKPILDSEGQPTLVDATTGRPISREQETLEIQERVPIDVDIGDGTNGPTGPTRFWRTVAVIELTDIAFAVDSILAAIALVGNPTAGTATDAVHPKLWLVITGGLLGVILMRFAAAVFIQLLERFPRFEISAYLLVLVIGVKLLADWGCNSDWSIAKPRWLAGRLGTWKQSFEDFEHRRRDWASGYDQWLARRWIIPIETADNRHTPPPNPGGAFGVHPPHLVDFHDLRRPECIAFWLLMTLCFVSGFWSGPPAAKEG